MHIPTSSKKKSTTLKRRRPKGEKGRRTKVQIQEAIIDLVSVDGLGLERIKLDQICSKAGITIGAFYFHFENKDMAINETAIDAMNDMAEALREVVHGEDLREELRQIILVYIQALVERPKQSRLVYAAIRSSPAVHQAYEQMHFEISDRLQALIARERATAGRAEKESQLVVEFLLAGIESFVENVYMWGNDRISPLGSDPDSLARKLAAMWINMATTQLPPAAR